MKRTRLTIVRRKTTGCNEPKQIYAGDRIPANYQLFNWTDKYIQAKWRRACLREKYTQSEAEKRARAAIAKAEGRE